jgi:hypothetical protein
MIEKYIETQTEGENRHIKFRKALEIFRHTKGASRWGCAVSLPIELDLGPYLGLCSFGLPLLLTIIALSAVIGTVPSDSKSMS